MLPAAVSLQRAASLEHEGLAVPADVGDQLDAAGRAHQRAALALLGQRGVVAHVGDTGGVTHITWSPLEQGLQFALVERGIEIA